MKHFVAALALLAAGAAAQNPIGCFVPGECTGGTILANTVEDSAAVCLEDCKARPDCNYFTHFSDNSVCSLYATCPLSDNACHDCVSGDRTCGFQCDIQGFCDGSSVAIDVTSAKEDCITECKDNEFCEWWSFDSFDGFCTLLSTCDQIDLSCATCVSGQKQCSATGTTDPPPTSPPMPDENILLIVGGFGGGFSAEAVDLRGEGRVCEELPMYPIFVTDAVGATSEGIPAVCGDLTPTTECYGYHPTEKAWVPFYDNMTQPRSHAIGVQLNEDDFLVLGGGQVDKSSGDLYTGAVRSFSSPISLPVNLTNACSANINSTHFFVSGGYQDIETTTDLWIYDIPNKEWKQMASMNGPRHYHGCGTVVTDNGLEIVVAGGHPDIATAEAYNLDIDSWRPVQDLPEGNRGMASVRYQDTLLLVGGLSLVQRHRIMEYQPDTETWFARPELVEAPRYSHVAMLVGDDIVSCPLP